MNKTQFFTASSQEDLQAQVNQWFENNLRIAVVEVKYLVDGDPNDDDFGLQHFYSILYKDLPNT